MYINSGPKEEASAVLGGFDHSPAAVAVLTAQLQMRIPDSICSQTHALQIVHKNARFVYTKGVGESRGRRRPDRGAVC